MIISRETAEEIVFRENRNAEFLGLFVFARCGGHVVVDEERGGAADAACNLTATSLDVCLQFVAILEVVDIASDDEGESFALVARPLLLLLPDFN